MSFSVRGECHCLEPLGDTQLMDEDAARRRTTLLCGLQTLLASGGRQTVRS